MKSLYYIDYFFLSFLGVLLLCTPFAIMSELVNGIIMGKLYWVQLILFIFSIYIPFSLFTKKQKPDISLTWNDFILPLIGIWSAIAYPWTLNPEPEKIIFIGQMVILWFILRYTISKYPMLGNYFLFVLIGIGLIEAIWGFKQLQGWTQSSHSLFRLTGSFFNPGPYSGYLAITLPIALGILLKQSKRNILYYFAMLCILTIIVILPAGMSRSAWIAAICSCAWVYAMYRLDWKRIKIELIQHKKPYIICGFLGCVLFLAGSTYFYTLKKDSADGRFLMWKVTAKAIQKYPVIGTGLGGFPAAYAEAQAEYMTSRKASEQEKWIAGCPEYAFNEYLQIGLEQGIIGLALFMTCLGSIVYKGIKNKRYACCGGIIALAIFAFSSYPLQLPEFWVVLIFLGVMCVTPNPDQIQKDETEPSHNEWYKRVFLIGVAILGITLFWTQKDYYRAYQKWDRAQMFYNNKAYRAALEEYEPLYPLLKHKPGFLFEAAQCLSKTRQFEQANEYLRRAVLLSADPMLYYMMAKNEQSLGQYRQAEKHLLHAIDILPERIYPYYLLMNLYTEPSYFQPAKLKMAIDSVLTKKPKVESSAIKEMKEKARSMLNNTSI
ncbi:hypothetical protein B5F32_00515 [Parabacteroides distasonis]|uniref:O-antigen ligase-related domain-containing protein n=1 Tax=Parabacteroides distasonis TaxID=823 RepID=A0A1Y4IUU2_PARDI|nr:hypothetical protein B5F32_00515 [Parabacteroides distasonis]